MDEQTKTIFSFLLILSEKVVSIESSQILILKWLSDIPDGDPEMRRGALDLAATVESQHEKVEAFIAAIRTVLQN